LRLPALTLRLFGRRGGVAFEDVVRLAFGACRMPALGLNGGVGKETLPILRPCPPRVVTCPCAGKPAAWEQNRMRTHTVTIFV
jgi:hypothetical protein